MRSQLIKVIRSKWVKVRRSHNSPGCIHSSSWWRTIQTTPCWRRCRMGHRPHWYCLCYKSIRRPDPRIASTVCVIIIPWCSGWHVYYQFNVTVNSSFLYFIQETGVLNITIKTKHFTIPFFVSNIVCFSLHEFDISIYTVKIIGKYKY